MTVSVTPLVERIARVLAGQRLSANAEGGSMSAAMDVDIEWRDLVDEAIAVLKTMREPDEAMASAGDEEIWEAMISAAIEQAPEGGQAFYGD